MAGRRRDSVLEDLDVVAQHGIVDVENLRPLRSGRSCCYMFPAITSRETR
jgi:hypothetical protein